MGELYNSFVKRRKVLKEEIQCRKIQKHFRKHFYMDKILKKQKVVDKFEGLINIIDSILGILISGKMSLLYKELIKEYILKEKL